MNEITYITIKDTHQSPLVVIALLALSIIFVLLLAAIVTGISDK